MNIKISTFLIALSLASSLYSNINIVSVETNANYFKKLHLELNGETLGRLHYSEESFTLNDTPISYYKVNYIEIENPHQRKGYGTILMKELESLARKNDVHLLQLYSANPPGSTLFYHKLGFKPKSSTDIQHMFKIINAD